MIIGRPENTNAKYPRPDYSRSAHHGNQIY